MKKILFLCVLFVIAGYSQVEAKGGPVPCIASCCFGDPRLGYYMNQGGRIEATDCITACVARPIGAFLTGGRENGVVGFLISCIFGNRAGQHWDDYDLRTWEILALFFPPLYLYMGFEQFQGKTWDEVVAAEGLQK